MAAIKDVLNKFKAAGVDLAAVVSTDGMQIESYSRGNVDVDSLCAIATTGLRISEALGHEMAKGEARQTVLEYEGGAVVLEPLNEDAMMLVVSADPNSIGRIRYMSKKYRQELVDALNNGAS